MAYIHNTDRNVGDSIYRSLSSIYNKRLVRSSDAVTHMIQQTIPVFRKLLNFDSNVKFRVAPIKGKYSGRYCHSERLIELDCRMPWDKALEVLAHELVHAEQFHECRLGLEWDDRQGWVYSWYGERNPNRGTTYKAYRNQPWEQEAYTRQAELAERVCSILEKKYP